MTYEQAISTLINEFGLEVERLSPYHVRIEKRLDIWPTTNRWYDLVTKEKGTYPDLLRFIIKRFESPVAAQCPKCKHTFFHNL